MNSKHTHTIPESKRVNLVRKTGPVPLTRFPETQKLDQKVSEFLIHLPKVLVTIEASASLFVYKISLLSVPFFQKKYPLYRGTIGYNNTYSFTHLLR